MEKEADIKKIRKKNERNKNPKATWRRVNKDGDIGGAETGNSFRDTKEKKQCLCD